MISIFFKNTLKKQEIYLKTKNLKMISVKGKEPINDSEENMGLVKKDDETNEKIETPQEDICPDHVEFLTEHTEKHASEIERSDYEIAFLKMFEGRKSDELVNVVNDDGEVYQLPLFIIAKISPVSVMLEDLGEILDEVPLKYINQDYLDKILHFYSLKSNSERKKYVSEDLLKVTDEVIDALKEKRFPCKDEYCSYAREICLKIQDFCNFVDFCNFGGKGDTDFMLLSKHSYWDINDEPLMGLYKMVCLHLSEFIPNVFDEGLKDKFFEEPEDKLTFKFAKGKIVEKILTEDQVKEIEEDNADGAPFVEILEGVDENGNTFKYRMKEEPTDEYYVSGDYKIRKHDFPIQILRDFFGHEHGFTYNSYIEELRINDILEGKISS